MLLQLAGKSLLNRKTTALLTMLSIAVSVFVLLGVEHIRHQAKSSFTRTLSGTDLIVGARTGQMNLLLYSVFRIGNATNNISWQSYQRIANSKLVKWHVPLSLGDSHKGYRVLGTTPDYFTYYRYGNKQPLKLASGKVFNGVFDVVLGAEVAQQLDYKIGDNIVLAHGVSANSFSLHDDKPFTVVGILDPTGTPVDRTLHVSLGAIEAIHMDWHNGSQLPNQLSNQQSARQSSDQDDLTPKNITAFLVGLKSKSATFGFQRMVNEYPNEALMAILPGATLANLWQMLGSLETILVVISALVLLSSLIGMSTMLLSSLRERNRELAILRAIGASPVFNMMLIEIEVILLTIGGIGLAMLSLFALLIFGQDTLTANYGLFIEAWFLTPRMLTIISAIIGAALLLGLIPGLMAYRRSLQQGLTIRQ